MELNAQGRVYFEALHKRIQDSKDVDDLQMIIDSVVPILERKIPGHPEVERLLQAAQTKIRLLKNSRI